MRLKNKKLFSLLILFFGVLRITASLADPLVLSDAEMQKLQKYFPSQDASQHLVWNGNPLSITLPINQEKRIIFSGHITPDLKNALSTDQLRITNDDKSIYLTALKAFSTTRMYVTLQNTGEVILIDLSTSDSANNATTQIDLPPNKNADSSTVTSSTFNNADSLSANDDNTASTSDSDNYVTLIRFAWQQLYAPERLVNNSLDISRAQMHTLPMLSSLIYGDKVYAHPEVSWVYNDTYVTAIELRNKYPHATQINLNHDLCGDWQAASLYPSATLKPAGDKPGDSTVLFLVSKEPFGNAMEICNGGA